MTQHIGKRLPRSYRVDAKLQRKCHDEIICLNLNDANAASYSPKRQLGKKEQKKKQTEVFFRPLSTVFFDETRRPYVVMAEPALQ